ncbi:hypothetical protein HPB51_013192 [Rhipicephalus microplus]|uniref:Uncharacterized protein n=1 Tax=Rhipicephalus microplus TaxID=6941 RepID=A0A9J6EGP4_RHIMP|nr:hypothetical protein HPB51_013192 [Rhipicephalus microplus]
MSEASTDFPIPKYTGAADDGLVQDWFNLFELYATAASWSEREMVTTFSDFVTGSEWKRVRSVLNPTFSSVKMRQMAPIVHTCVDTMMEVLDERCGSQQTVDMLKVAQGYSLDVITKCAFAWQVDCQKNPNDPQLLGVRKIFEEAESAAVCNAIRFPLLRVVLKSLYRLSDYYKVIQHLTNNLRQVIELRRREPKVSATDMLQLMLEAQAGAEIFKNGPIRENGDYVAVASSKISWGG